jgi:hypothetical protein
MPSGPVVASLVLLVAALVGGVYLYLELRHQGGSRTRDRQRPGDRLPLFGTDLLVDRGGGARPRPIVPARPMSRTEPARPESSRAEGSRPEMPRPATRDFAPPAPASVAPIEVAAAAPFRTMPSTTASERAATAAYASVGNGAAAAAPPPIARMGGAVPMMPGDGAMHDGETVRFSIPDEGTLQFLPGRLEIFSGPDKGRDVRFVRTGGERHPEITFGRSEGPPYRHVQLMARTVSRQHAAMSLIDGHWELKNLSATNPVQLNGRPLEAGEVAPLLVDGDRIEMGEIVFVFHDR